MVLLPALEHAPDHTADRPFVTLSVTACPVLNEAEPLDPTATLIPAGLDDTCSPDRPVAVTVSVAPCDAGVTVRAAVRVDPPALAVIVTGVEVVTAFVVIAKAALVAPWATDTLDGTAASGALLDSDTENPPAGAAAVNVTVPCADAPPATLVGFTETADRAAGAGGGATVSAAERVTPPKVPVMVADVDAVTATVLTAKVALVLPAATVTFAGTAAALELLVKFTTIPPDGAALVSLAVPWELLPPTTLVGLSVIADSVGADVRACGVKRRAEEKALAAPAELIVCTRHQCCRAARVGRVSCEAATV